MANIPEKPSVELVSWINGRTKLNQINLTTGVNANLANIKTAVDGIIDVIDEDCLLKSAGQDEALTGVLYSNVNDISLVGTQGKAGFRAYKPNTNEQAAQMLLTSDGTVSGSYRLSAQTYNKTQSDAAGSTVYNTLRMGDTEGLTYKIGSDVKFKVNDSGVATVGADPIGDLDVATKQYVDNQACLVETTWSALKALRDGGNLVPGQQYRITDYQCTTITTDTSSAGHQFDIIVVADSADTLNEQARAICHSGDAYFASNRLEAWKLWYCLDNNTQKFAWADATNGKGVIYRMIDEHGNDCPYDFKNILFKAKYFAFLYRYTDYYIADTQRVPSSDTSIDGVNYYAFSFRVIVGPGGPVETYYAATLDPTFSTVWYSISSGVASVTDKVIVSPPCKGKAGTFYYTFSNRETNPTDNSKDGTARNNTISPLKSSVFGCALNENVFFGVCYNNELSFDCQHNIFADYCYQNQIGTGFSYNNVGSNFNSNRIGNDVAYNRFVPRFESNVVGNLVSRGIFGPIDDSVSITSYIRSCYVDSGVQCIQLTNTSGSSDIELKNIHIHSGVGGSTYLNRAMIAVDDSDLAYEIDVYQAADGTLIYKKNNEPAPLFRYNGYIYIFHDSTFYHFTFDLVSADGMENDNESFFTGIARVLFARLAHYSCYKEGSGALEPRILCSFDYNDGIHYRLNVLTPSGLTPSSVAIAERATIEELGALIEGGEYYFMRENLQTGEVTIWEV